MNTKMDLIKRIQKELEQQVDEKTKNSFQRFFKEQVAYHGVKTAVVGRISRKYFMEIRNMSKQEIFALCEGLLALDYGEEAGIAFDWAYWVNQKYEPADLAVLKDGSLNM